MLSSEPWRYTCPPVFSRNFILLIFMFRPIICLKLIYMHDMRINSIEIQLFSMFAQLIQLTFLSLWIVLEPLSKINRQYMWVYFWTLFKFLWSICLFMPAPLHFKCYSFTVNLKSNSINPPTLFLFKVILTMLCLLHFMYIRFPLSAVITFYNVAMNTEVLRILTHCSKGKYKVGLLWASGSKCFINWSLHNLVLTCVSI